LIAAGWEKLRGPRRFEKTGSLDTEGITPARKLRIDEPGLSGSFQGVSSGIRVQLPCRGNMTVFSKRWVLKSCVLVLLLAVRAAAEKPPSVSRLPASLPPNKAPCSEHPPAIGRPLISESTLPAVAKGRFAKTTSTHVGSHISSAQFAGPRMPHGFQDPTHPAGPAAPGSAAFSKIPFAPAAPVSSGFVLHRKR
jgi:hypothetical protein